MSAALRFFETTIGKKVVMSLTGIVLWGFVVAHLAGNLQVYLGAHAMDDYAVFLRGFLHGTGIWIFRTVLLTSVILHIWAAVTLTLQNRRARPVGYRKLQSRDSTISSRTMRLSGIVIIIFVIYHILHFTTGQAHPDFHHGKVYDNFIVGFRVIPVSIFYIFAMVCLGLHLYHGVWSMLQTLGLSHPRYNGLRHGFAALITAIVVIGNISFPLAVILGLIQ
jgi:succinate dehydrogenase / fumarate reductase, cytochrome b subunit